MTEREKLIQIIDNSRTYVADKESLTDHLIANGVTFQKWIPVSERLPNYFGTFLVAIDEVHGEKRVSVDAADFDPFAKKWTTCNYFCAGFKITHWMPLPNPPEKE